MMPTIRRIQPIVWMFTPLTVYDTAKARTAPTAARKIPTPRPMVLLRSLTSEVRPGNGGAPVSGAGGGVPRNPFRLGSRPDAQGFHRVAARARDRRRRDRRGGRARPPVAPEAGLERGQPHPVPLLVRGRDLHRDFRARGRRDGLLDHPLPG